MSEDFSSIDRAMAFVALYTEREYPDIRIGVWDMDTGDPIELTDDRAVRKCMERVK